VLVTAAAAYRLVVQMHLMLNLTSKDSIGTLISTKTKVLISMKTMKTCPMLMMKVQKCLLQAYQISSASHSAACFLPAEQDLD